MSNAEITTDPFGTTPGAVAEQHSRFAGWFANLESLLSKFGERLNPILIKEARQALKSKQFTITFVLVLIAGWCWSIVGIAWMGPGVYWAADGPSMFYGYFLILAFPLLVVVPFGAFRSLSAEREDRTYELLSITTLRPRQIVGGKLAGAFLQMLVYLSAISPCLAFTYLLRGLDVLTIAMIVLYLFFGSLGLSMVCLLLATVINEKYQQVIFLVVIVFGLGFAFLFASGLAGQLLSWNPGFDDEEFWIVNGVLATIYVSYFALFYAAAATQLSFVGSNRSTLLRAIALVQQALFLGWMGVGFLLHGTDVEVLVAAGLILAIHWYVMGIFMTGEPARLSPRVMRELPQSFLGRTFLTWFNPGPATGYIFALASYLGGLVLLFGELAAETRGRSTIDLVLICLLCFSYLVIFLGTGRFILARVARYTPVTITLRVLCHLVLVLLATLMPVTIHLTLSGFRNEGYSVLQATNPFWTLAVAAERNPPADIWGVAVLLILLALTVFAFNLPAVAEEVRQVRIAAPKRVAEEDAQLAAAHAPATPTKTNPWDE